MIGETAARRVEYRGIERSEGEEGTQSNEEAREQKQASTCEARTNRGGREQGPEPSSAKRDAEYASIRLQTEVQKRGNLRVGGAMAQRSQRMECKMGLKGWRFEILVD